MQRATQSAPLGTGANRFMAVLTGIGAADPVPKQVSLRRRFLLVLVSLLTLLWFTAFWQGRDTEAEAVTQIEREASALALAFAEQSQSTFERLDFVLGKVREAWALGPAEFERAIHANESLLSGITLQVAVIDAQGYLAYSNLAPARERTFLGDREHFKVHATTAQDRLFVSDPVKGRVSGKWSIQMTRPILANGAFAGVVVLSVDPGYFVRFYQKIDNGRDGLVAMVRSNGTILARSNEQDKYIGTKVQGVPFTEADAPEHGSFRRLSRVDSIERIYGYRKLAPYGVTVVIGSGVNEHLAPLRAEQRVTLLLRLAATALVLIMAWALYRGLLRREAVERELRLSESRFRTLADSAPVLIWISDADQHRHWFNKVWCDFTGQDQSQAIERPWTEGLHEEDRAGFVETTGEHHRHHRAYLVEYRLRRHDGQYRWLLENGVPRFDDAGQFVGYIGSSIDITDRKLSESREQHRSQVLELLNAKAALSDVLDLIARSTESLSPETLCSILLLDESGTHLRHGAAPSLPDFYTQAIDGLAIGPGVGSCGTAAFTEQRVVVEDIATHPYWAAFTELTQRAGLAACWSQPIRSAQGKVLGTFGLYRRSPGGPSAADLHLIEEQSSLASLAIEKSLAEARLQLTASVFSHAREGILITDSQGRIIEVNETFSRVTGYSREEVIGENPKFLQSGRHDADFYARMWRDLNEKGHWYGEVWNRRKNEELFAELLTISAVRDAKGVTRNFVGLFTDITMMKEHEQQLEHIAHYDVLTNLPNRVLLADRLQHAMVQAQRRNKLLAVAYLDLDGFKAVNDQHGHDIGDQLLVTLSHRLKDTLRDGDSLARIGGDEFVAVLCDMESPQDCEPVIERLLQVASSTVTLQGLDLRVSASIGVTVSPPDDGDADQLVRHADQAMYVAKQAGKNRFHVFDVDQDAAVKTQREGLEQIRVGLEQREFVLHYQPKVNLRTGAVIGMEALIRWQHPQRGLLAPYAFLPIVENHALSVDIGEWVIASALSQISLWQQQGLQLNVSVNVGARQLQQANFASRLSALLAQQPDVTPESLQLEVLETSALEDVEQVSKVMYACRAMGVSFALDDFGTGYSSLTYLKRLPARVLKIDQSFVRDMLEDPDDLAIVKGVVGLAAAFHREVVAEGVETLEHGRLLLPLGCEVAQGYGIARPMPAADVPAWVHAWSSDFTWGSVRESL